MCVIADETVMEYFYEITWETTSEFCCTTVKLAATYQKGTLANYGPKMNGPLLLLHSLSKLPFQFIFHNVTILGHHKLR